MSGIVDRLRAMEAERLGKGWGPSVWGEAADEIVRLRAEIQRLENECYKKCGVCEFDYGRAAPPIARSGDSG